MNYQVYTKIQSLPANSLGKRRVKTYHIDDNLDALGDYLENLIEGVFSAPGEGGIIVPGTVDTSNPPQISVSNRMGITREGIGIVAITDPQTVDASTLTNGNYFRVSIYASPAFRNNSFTDPETFETISQSMVIRLGQLLIDEGDGQTPPPLSPIAAPVLTAKWDSGAFSDLALEDAPPRPRWNTAGSTANRPTQVYTGLMHFDTALGKPVWWDGTQWVDATGTAV